MISKWTTIGCLVIGLGIYRTYFGHIGIIDGAIVGGISGGIGGVFGVLLEKSI